MIRQTGGFSLGATSTKSSPASRARDNASSVGIMPSWAPSAEITRIGVIRICSLIRCCFSMAHVPGIGSPGTNAVRTGRTRAMSPRAARQNGLLRPQGRQCSWEKSPSIPSGALPRQATLSHWDCQAVFGSPWHILPGPPNTPRPITEGPPGRWRRSENASRAHGQRPILRATYQVSPSLFPPVG